MGSFATVVFTFTVIALGMVGLKHAVTPTRGSKPGKVDPTVSAIPERLQALVDALNVEGFFGLVKTQDASLVYVDHPVLAEMIETINAECELMWLAPKVRLRYRRTPDEAPTSFRDKYGWVLCTPTHAVGFNRRTRNEAAA